MKIKRPYLRLVDVAHHWGPKEVFSGVDISVHSHDVIGLIGPNGAGKSTLLSILSGEVEARSGQRELKGDIGVVSQGLDADPSLTVLEYTLGDRELEEREVMVALGKADGESIDIHQELGTLSGGQKTKVRITKCLLNEVDILLLDEPTNHLDISGIRALQGIVKRFHGPVVIVSHDRQFLDDVVTGIFDLRFGSIEEYTGNYTQYMAERAQRGEKQLEKRKNQETKRVRAEKWLADLRQRASVYDSPRWGKLIRSRQKLYERTFDQGGVRRPESEKQLAMHVTGGKHQWKKMLTIGEGVVGRAKEGKAIFVDEMPEGGQELYMICEELEILGQDRLVVSGSNGTGKTTLLDVCKDHLPNAVSPHGDHQLICRGNDMRIGWFAQHEDALVVDEIVISRCMTHFPDARNESYVRGKLASAGIPTEDLVKKMSQLSYGQRVKIRFLQLMLSSYDVLILDEPTNHLDIQTRESLEMMLQQYEGALIVVSHDRRFVEQIGVMMQWSIVDELLEKSPRVSLRKEVVSEKYVFQEKVIDEEEVDPYDFMG